MAMTSSAMVLLLTPTPMRDRFLKFVTDFNLRRADTPWKVSPLFTSGRFNPGDDVLAVEVLAKKSKEFSAEDTRFGTAFFVTADGHLVTASYVVERMKSPHIRLMDGQQFAIQVLNVDRAAGLALLKAKTRPRHVARWATPRTGEKVTIQGLRLWLDSRLGWVGGVVMASPRPNSKADLIIGIRPVNAVGR